MKYKITIFIFTVLIAFAFAQDNLNNDDKSLPRFYYDALNFKGDATKTKVEFFVMVPYVHLKFLKNDNMFAAKYRVTITVVSDFDKKIVAEKSWIENVSVKDFIATTNKNNFNLSNKSIMLTNELCNISCEVEDLDTQKKIVQNDKFTVRNMNNPIVLSDILFLQKYEQTSAKRNIYPNITRNVSIQKNGFPIMLNIYSDQDKDLKLEYKITTVDEKSAKELYNSKELYQVLKGTNNIVKKFDSCQLSLGKYRLEVCAYDSINSLIARTSKVFTSYWIGMPNNNLDMNKAVDQMVYIASSKELDEIREAKSEAEKRQKYIEFWQKRDPTPGTEENEIFDIYYQRIAYANQQFKSYKDGWKSDMGMIFILLGQPDNIERHPFEFDSKPYEIWSYYQLNYRFAFVDETGFGEYRLLTPVYSDWYKFRP